MTRTFLRTPPLLAAVLLSALVVVSGALVQPGQAIVDGTRAEAVHAYDGSFQRVDSPRPNHHVCGATLIAPSWAVTAGHCTRAVQTAPSLKGDASRETLLQGSPTGWRVRLGSKNISTGGRLVDVAQFVRRSAGIELGGDIALLRLRKPVRSAPVAMASATPAAGTAASIQGWGYTTIGGRSDFTSNRSYPNALREARVSILVKARCGIETAEAALCVGTDADGPGPDNMDSGGPVYVTEKGRTVLAGTVSSGNLVGEDRPAIYTDVSANRAWIESYVSGRATITDQPAPTGVGMAGAGEIRPSSCSTSVVRTPRSMPSDPAMVLTNGHCLDPRPVPGGHLADQPDSSFVILYGPDGNPVTRATTTRLLYATMTDTDVALFRLKETYAELASLQVPARTLASQGPRPGDDLLMLSGGAQTTMRCTVQRIVPTLREGDYTLRQALRYRASRTCPSDSVTSGSPLVDRRTGEVVAIHNTHVRGGGKPCSDDNPCEVQADGSVSTVLDRSYAQQVAGLTPCIAAGSVLDLGRPGCAVPRS